jgi:hypothetical protein
MKYGIRYNSQGWWVYEVAANKIVSGPHYFKWVARSKSDAFNERGV